ncbi:hypothetical protein [Acidithrix sp. C25]|uniref:hypothetical protein n=1 Tax=Acidithrix sp. C25 TaxID=1671482 RepID=UPI00191B9C0A|nr:hypothetical protein [Acidithrix sp. C25]CAG4931779.1 unnamed protein product [Acidithrix sp. C25]
MSRSAAARHREPQIFQTGAEEVVFRNVQADPDSGPLSRYGDDAWLLHPMAQKLTSDPLKIDFATLPSSYRDTGKRLVWTFINERTPMDALSRPTAIRDRLAAGSILTIFHDIRMFLKWLDARAITDLRSVTPGDYRAYASYVAGRSVTRDVKGRQLFSVTRIWLIAPYLPPEDRMLRPTWEDIAAQEDRIDSVIGPANWTGENKRLPVHPQSMSALLLAALRFIEVFRDDILDAVADKARMQSQIPLHQEPEHVKRANAYLHRLKASGGSLPGMRGTNPKPPNDINLAIQYLAATLGITKDQAASMGNRGLAIRLGTPMPTTITGLVDGEPWCSAIDYYEVEQMRHMLMVACFIVVAYLSGMRVEECRALRRGSCTATRPEPDMPPHFEIRGLSFKDALDEDGNAIPGGVERETPWIVLEPVAKAIATAEAMHSSGYVFTRGLFRAQKQEELEPPLAQAARDSIRSFVDWWNAYCQTNGNTRDVIPPDPDGAIVPARFRRTLAWFIYRVPGGRIALGLQYGHLRGYTSDAYGSRVASGLRDVFPMEEALAVAESLHEAARRLDAGEQVSGPASSRYVNGVRIFQQTFGGSYLTTRQMAALRRDPRLRIYDNPSRALACVYDQTKALCHPDRDRGRADVTRTPDMSRCRDNCGNTARTDTHAELLQAEIGNLREEAENPLTPEPIRVRLLARIVRRENELQVHAEQRSVS